METQPEKCENTQPLGGPAENLGMWSREPLLQVAARACVHAAWACAAGQRRKARALLSGAHVVLMDPETFDGRGPLVLELSQPGPPLRSGGSR